MNPVKIGLVPVLFNPIEQNRTIIREHERYTKKRNPPGNKQFEAKGNRIVGIFKYLIAIPAQMSLSAVSGSAPDNRNTAASRAGNGIQRFVIRITSIILCNIEKTSFSL